MQTGKIIYKITTEGVNYTCHGERKIVNGQLMYMFYRIPGINADVILCPDPESDNPELYKMTIVPGTTTYKVEEYVEPRQPKCLTFTANEDLAGIIFGYDGLDDPVDVVNLEYSLDGGVSWITYNIVEGEEITLNTGESVMFRGINESLRYYDADMDTYQYVICSILGSVAASGDITSLLNGIGGDYPVPEECFSGMFADCTTLTTAPELPSTTLANWCYVSMFQDCAALTTVPELPAMTLAEGCYNQMFYGCESLTTSPELPATALAGGCYQNMFRGCTSLTTAPELPVTTLAESCYSSMFTGCTSLTTAPELPATTLANNCYEHMFSGCTSLTTAPELPATELVTNCYQNMFTGCTSLEYIKALFTTDPVVIDSGSGKPVRTYPYTYDWVNNVSGSGTFVKNSEATWDTTDDNIVPPGWTVEDAA